MQQEKIFVLKNKIKLNILNSDLIISGGLNNSLVKVKNSLVDLGNNKFFIKKDYYKNSLTSFLENLKLILKGGESSFFVHLTITGLGFRIRRYVKKNVCFLRIELGYSHFIYYPLPSNVFFIKGRKKCLVYSNDFNLLKRVVMQLTNLRKTNPYKEKGLLITDKLNKKKLKKAKA